MTPTERPPTFSPGQLADAFEDLVAGRRADYRDDLVGQVRATPQRPAWTFIERWLPMSLVIARPATATPLRGAWFLLLAGLVIAALVASLVIVGSALLRDEGPDGLDFGLVPTLELDETWQTTDSGAIEAAGIAVGLDGDLYAVDVPGDRIVVLDADGDLVHEWGSQGNGEGQFEFATYGPTSLEWGSVAVAPDGSVYVADTLNRRVQEFRPDGTFVRAWGGHGPDDGRFLMPIDVSVGADGTVYVVDTQREDIQAFTPDGTFLRVVEEGGASDGDPTRATGTRLDVGRSSYDIDLANGRLNAWLPDRHFHSSLLTNGTGALSLSTPGIKESSDTWTWELIDVAVAPDRTIYVAEPDWDPLESTCRHASLSIL